MPTPEQILKKNFGYDSFRGGQKELIDAVLAGRDALGIMPTGAGKSVCFQVPALLMDGITLVVSPLVSLMKDQVGALVQLGVRAAYINSSLTPRQIDLALANAAKGMYKLIYVAPERLLTPNFLAFAQNADIAMLTVDEAHCVSQWGQDFRPSYLQIATFLAQLPRRPVVSAFTATATQQVRTDVVRALALREPKVLVTGFDRPNLYFSVLKASGRAKFSALLAFLQQNPDATGIVYCLARRTVEEVCARLNEAGISATRYHAGLSDAERRDNQDDFLYDRAQVMVATNAFGMGIDKSNVGYVVHYNMPKDIESYYQEAGRAGRDGAPAQCLLLYCAQDIMTNRWLIEHGKDEAELDDATRAQLMQRDEARLRQMAAYAQTRGCLRAFILDYFGEENTAACGHCGNCDGAFDTQDATREARAVLDCVQQTGQRYGAGLVADVLRGSRGERVRTLGFDALPVYGTCKDMLADRLRAVAMQLAEEGFLSRSDDEYAVLSLLPRAAVLQNGEETFTAKLPREAKAAPRAAAKKRTPAGVAPERAALYAQLRAVRAEFAAAQKVPAYMIFSDKALAEMCARLPKTAAEFAEVPGVGEQKLRRYGQAFTAAVAEFCGEVPAQPDGDFFAAGDGPEESVPAPGPVTVSVLAYRLTEALGEKITAVKLGAWLEAEGWLATRNGDRAPTEKGAAAGIKQEHRHPKKGVAYNVNIYPAAFEQTLLAHAEEIRAFVHAPSAARKPRGEA